MQPGDIGELPRLRPAFGDRHASGTKIQMHDFRAAVIAQLFGQEDRLVAGATPGHQGSEWPRKILFALEAVEVDDLEKIVPAVLQPHLLVFWISKGIGIGLVLVSHGLQVIGLFHWRQYCS